MKIAISQLNYQIGNFSENKSKIIEAIENAKKEQVDLIVFSELSVCGYPPHDLLEQKDFIEQSGETIIDIAKYCDTIAAIVGAPSINKNPRGKRLHNSAYFLSERKIQNIFHKTLLPTYDVFDEYRYFEPNDHFELLEIKNKKIAITICEDLWDEQPSQVSFAKDKLYQKIPLEELSKLHPDFIINISASPFSYNQHSFRREILTKNAQRFQLPIIYVNQIGAQTELIFDGASQLISSSGNIIKELKSFEEDTFVFYTALLDSTKEKDIKSFDRIELVHDALILGIKDYFQKLHFKTATLGLSGGIDSAVTLALAVKALGNENLRVLLMPSAFSSDHSIKDAIDLADKLNVAYDIIKINGIVDGFNTALYPIFEGLEEGIAEENIQARARGTLLMALSNKFGNILLNTSNKSEAAVGYGTLYGDMNGGLSVLGDVYKTDVYKLAEFINRFEEIIPVNTIVKPPSAELRPNQVDQDSLPPYDVLDTILFSYIELKKSASEIINEGFESNLVHKVLRMVNINEYKRFQSPPILRVSSKAFGFGRRMPLVAKY